MTLEQRQREITLRYAQQFNRVAAKIGALTNLQTDAKTSLVAALNELFDVTEGLEASRGDLSTLSTAAKGSLVAALNEINGVLQNATNIDDAAATTTTTYSSSKIVSLVQGAVSEILDGAPEALDTLKEVAAELGNQDSAMQTLLSGLVRRIRFDAAQNLTAEQALQARQNIQAVGVADIGDYNLDLVALFNSALSDLASQ